MWSSRPSSRARSSSLTTGPRTGRRSSSASFDAPLPIKVVCQANRGQSAARNVGVELAIGELIAFLDDDDQWRRNHLEVLVRAISKKPEIAWAYNDFDEMDTEGRTVMHSFMREHHLVHPKTSLASCLASDLMVLPSASLLRKAAFDDVGGFDERLSGYEDDDLFVRMFRADWKHVFVPKPLTRFRIHANGTNSSSSLGFLDSRMTFLEKLIGSIEDDDRMNRYWVRDLVLPRFFLTTVDDYARALSRSRWVEAARCRRGGGAARGDDAASCPATDRGRIDEPTEAVQARAAGTGPDAAPAPAFRQPDTAPPHPQPLQHLMPPRLTRALQLPPAPGGACNHVILLSSSRVRLSRRSP